MENEIIIPELNNETIRSMIYTIRGEKVMLDFELAKIYGYETRTFNQQVVRNINKFPKDFMFQIITTLISLMIVINNTKAFHTFGMCILK